MKLYLVTYVTYGEVTILGVYTTQEQAEQICEKYIKKGYCIGWEEIDANTEIHYDI